MDSDHLHWSVQSLKKKKKLLITSKPLGMVVSIRQKVGLSPENIRDKELRLPGNKSFSGNLSFFGNLTRGYVVLFLINLREKEI